ncbi:RluA family pseudouridine synthase [Pontibacillus yanchengensis]|uniref:RluA family pseudouridine synthase n=2 Tax=Pontibacillus yanchengensis TaxID=462910 RepID=A0ACC7VCP6_9BACI|nr:RluA family pseudouridine synthase [Pontibacillus yanchengensis]MYL35076.1 RluA family pseudouridine synthase [Pontibacillus yanchengensis]MYL52557.1 RluA family pseudouridine synthase [Pontibacillus yanchengensis]
MKMSKKGEWLEIQVSKDWVGNSIEYILKNLLHVPKKQLHQLRMENGAKRNGEDVAWSTELQIGDKLQVHLFPKEELDVQPTYMDVKVLFEDEHVLVVNKPAGMNVHPNVEGQTDTLANGVAFHFKSQGLEAKVRHIHRLDQDTTGAVIFTKHALAGSIMDRLLEQKKIKRTYIALIKGKVTKKKGTINEPIGKDRHHPSRRRVSPKGQDAITHYEVLKYHAKKDQTVVKIDLETGRTHQIRVHMSHIGHPLVGDVLYGGKKQASRQALHAAKITFPHPITDEKIECIAPFLDDLFPPDSTNYLE